MTATTRSSSPSRQHVAVRRRWAGARAARLCRAIGAAALLVLVGTARAPSLVAETPPDGSHWVATWSASPHESGAPLPIDGQTLRQEVRTSLAGRGVRVRISNAYGRTPLIIGAVHAALGVGGGAIVPSTDRVLTFAGSPTIAIPAGALAVTDPVLADLPALSEIAISLYLPGPVLATTYQAQSMQTTYLSGPGDFTAAAVVTGTTTQSYYFLTGVEVMAPKRAAAIVALGDSVTVGFGSTSDANRRWPDLLANRLQADASTRQRAVLNAGVVGNRILHDDVGTNVLARLDRDVLVQPGVKYLIVLAGNADILFPQLVANPAEEVSAEQIIQGHRQIIERAHALGVTVYGSTLNPVEGYPFPGFWTPALEAKRQAVNDWIRASGAYDAVIDFDVVLRDPTHPSRLAPAFDSGDHVHPNDSGYAAMAAAIDLAWFRDGGQ